MTNLYEMRREYMQKSLDESEVKSCPMKQFECWFSEAVDSKIPDANACTLATCGADLMPDARIVLLKRYDKNGFIFFTNYESKKSHDLKQNQKACINFAWIELERQIRINGVVTKIPRLESMAYFATRDRGSQLGAWVSKQSKLIESAKALRMQVQKMSEKFKNKEIPLPDFWGGYRLEPMRIEFWQGRESRLHDRILYSKQQDTWSISRLAP